MRDNFLPLSRPVIADAEIAEVAASLRSGWLTTGPKAAEFEAAMTAYLGSDHVVAVSSCTGALHACLLAHGVAGGEVITTPITWPATSNVIWHAGAQPVFVDVEEDTLNIDVDLVEAAITPKTRAILPVHMAGQPCDLHPLRAIADRHGLALIEDAAHAIGASYYGEVIGTGPSAACFSFYATKNMTTGEGGLVATDDADLAARVRLITQNGIARDAWSRESPSGLHWQLIEPGLVLNLSDLLASIGLHQVGKLDAHNTRRRELVETYRRELASAPGLSGLAVRPGRESADHLFVVQVDAAVAGVTRDDMTVELRDRNIGTGVHFRSTHLQPYYRDQLGMRPSDLPVAARVSERILSLPLFAAMTKDDVLDVVEAVHDVIDAAT